MNVNDYSTAFLKHLDPYALGRVLGMSNEEQDKRNQAARKREAEVRAIANAAMSKLNKEEIEALQEYFGHE